MASIDRRPNSKWRARWREYPGGPQRTKLFGRKIDAERHLVEVQHRLATGSYIAPEASRVGFDAFVATHLARQPWRTSTADVAADALSKASLVFADRPLGSIRRGDVQAFISGLDLAPSTVRVVRQHLVSLFGAAVDDQLIATNPAKGVKLPERTKGEIVPPTPDEIAALVEAAAPWFRIAVVLGAGLGLRQSEVSGLTADRIDWLGRTVLIDRQWTSRRGRAEFTPPKTGASYRAIPASQWVLDALSEHVGRRHTGHVLHRAGRPVGHGLFNAWWVRARDDVGLEGMRFHDLRHGFASALISAGCSIKAVQRALGHASAATTLDIYAHLWGDDEDHIRAAVDRALGPAEDQLRTVRPLR
jgi:integrase